jgi:hypothetical protein
MTIPVLWHSFNPDSPNKGYWDQGLIEDLLNNKMWKPADGFNFIHLDKGFVDHWLETPDYSQEGAIMVIPARSNAAYIDEINRYIAKFEWLVLMLTGDEENIFPIDKLSHPKMKVYVMSPRETLDIKKYRILGTGYPPQLHDHVSKEVPDKHYDYFFAGQVTHERRQEMMTALRMVNARKNDIKGFTFSSQGFTQGLPQDEYHVKFSESKVAPCPSGPETPDTFRLFEALELGCVPLADTRVTIGGFSDDYWTFFFGEQPPFPVITDYDSLHGYMQDQVREYPRKNNRVFSWWQSKKRDMAYTLKQDIEELSGVINEGRTTGDRITVIIPVSPIKSHPDTQILEETINSVRHHLPDSEIILTFDGVRKENANRRDDYEEFVRRMLWKCNFEYKNVLPIIFDRHEHQTGMARAIIDKIKTPLLLYVEQDTPLVTDYEIPFQALQLDLMLGTSDAIRFHHEGIIPKDHDHMMLGEEPMIDDPLMRTCQWSQRPHLSTVAFYRRILNTCFSESAKSFIEDKMHGVVHNAYLKDGLLGWEQYKVHIYYPQGNIKRSYHTDGRAGEAKYDDTQVF